MTTAQVVETPVTVNNNSPIQDYVDPDDHTQPTYKMTLGFKPFTKKQRIVHRQSLVACENIRFSSLFATGDVSHETSPAAKSVASRAGVFRGARFSSLSVGGDEKRALLKTPAWEATKREEKRMFSLARPRELSSATQPFSVSSRNAPPHKVGRSIA